MTQTTSFQDRGLTARVASGQAFLFVPGHRPDRFASAVASGADDIIIDLEDAVAPEMKPAARENVREWRARGGEGIVRINGPSSAWYQEDLAMLRDRPCVVMLPKAESPKQIADVLGRLPTGSCVLPIVETALGVVEAPSICGAPGVSRVAFGNGDLANDLGIEHDDREALTYARSALVVASAARRIPSPIDGVTTRVDDEQRLVEDTCYAAALGFTAKLCIHPRQVAVVHARLTPSAEQVHLARQIVAAASRGASVTTVAGEMIDKPIVDRARKLLDRAGVSITE